MTSWPERREAVESAFYLVGKRQVLCHLLGFPLEPAYKVWAEGNSTIGTYRPFGLDCTGFLDWAFRNAGLHSDGH